MTDSPEMPAERATQRDLSATYALEFGNISVNLTATLGRVTSEMWAWGEQTDLQVTPTQLRRAAATLIAMADVAEGKE